jgi:3-hydroxypropanoate dehydrogenase
MTNVLENEPAPQLHKLDEQSQAALFTAARTANSFDPAPIGEDQLRSIYELAKWAPTSANFGPLRVLFVQTPDAREKLVATMSENNKAKTLAAPAVAVLAYDREFHEHLPVLAPHLPTLPAYFAENEGPRLDAARNNSWIQAGYFLLAVRAEGLAAGPMSGFDAAATDEAFFGDGRWGSFLVVNIGHPTEDSYRDRLPRMTNEQSVRFV